MLAGRGHTNTLRWDGRPGHYEVCYLTLTQPRSGVGVWIRYTLVARGSAHFEYAQRTPVAELELQTS